MVQASNNNKASTKKLTILVIILIVITGILAGGYLYQKHQYTELEQESQKVQEYLKAERDSLQKELRGLRTQYDKLETQNDTLQKKISVKKEKIDRLLNINAANVRNLKKYKKEIGTLRDVLKDFVAQIDSLNRRNKQLRKEKEEVSAELEETQSEKEKLEQTKEDLSSKVKQAEALVAKNIKAEGLNKRSNVKDEIDKIVRLRVCFTLRQNSVADPGKRWVYLRIERPDTTVLTSAATNMIEYQNKKIVYSAKRQINYENKDIDMCIYYDNDEDELIPGQYKLSLYSKGYRIGTSTFSLEEGGFLFF